MGMLNSLGQVTMMALCGCSEGGRGTAERFGNAPSTSARLPEQLSVEGFAFLFVTSVLFYLSLLPKSASLPIQKRFESVYGEQHEKCSICILLRYRQYVTIIIKLSHPKTTIGVYLTHC